MSTEKQSSGIAVDALVEAVTQGVLRALEARSLAEDDGSLADLVGKHGIFGTVVVHGGLVPRGPGPFDGLPGSPS